MKIDERVRTAEVDGRVVVLDLRSESYHVFDPVASSMWRGLTTLRDAKAMLDRLQDEYDVDRPRLEADFRRFAARCRANRFLADTSWRPAREIPARARVGGNSLLAIRAWWSLWRTARLLRRRGFAETYERFAATTVLPPMPAGAEALLERPVAAFAAAENFFHLKRAPEDCVPRSLALFAFLRARGLPVEHAIGVQVFPFLAHAWVEFRGRVVHDDPVVARKFTKIARITA